MYCQSCDFTLFGKDAEEHTAQHKRTQEALIAYSILAHLPYVMEKVDKHIHDREVAKSVMRNLNKLANMAQNQIQFMEAK